MEQQTKYDAKSRYYDTGGIEVIEIIKAKLTPDQYRGYLLGNVLKYACRMEHKGHAERDAEKLKMYAGWLSDATEDTRPPCSAPPMEMAEDYVEQMRRDVREPERVPHPGEVLRDMVTEPHKPRRSIALMLEAKTGIGWVYWSEVLLGRIILTDQAAEALAKVLDKPAEFWLNLQRNYDAQKQTQADRKMEERQ